jgi:hypothetical protein
VEVKKEEERIIQFCTNKFWNDILVYLLSAVVYSYIFDIYQVIVDFDRTLTQYSINGQPGQSKSFQQLCCLLIIFFLTTLFTGFAFNLLNKMCRQSWPFATGESRI